MKSIKGELMSMAWTLVIPCAIASVFPYEALRFRASRDSGNRVGASIVVSLSPEMEKQAIAIAKTSWRGDTHRSDRPRTDLMISNLPADDSLPVMPLELRRSRETEILIEMPTPPYLPSCAAEPPKKIKDDGAWQVFSREEMLKIN